MLSEINMALPLPFCRRSFFAMSIIISFTIFSRRDFEKCAQIKEEQLRDDCRIVVARILADEDLCRFMETKFGKSRCLSIVSIVKKDTGVCDLWGEEEPYEKQECVDRAMSFIIAEDGDKETISKCADLKTLEYEKLCLINSYQNKFDGDCDLVPQAYREYCVAQAIISGWPDIEDCDKISMKNSKETYNYRDFCYKVAQMGMDKASGVDSDGDGVSDGNELFMNLDPKNPDTDSDGLTDGEEWIVYGTNPAIKDTNQDGVDDYAHIMDKK